MCPHSEQGVVVRYSSGSCVQCARMRARARQKTLTPGQKTKARMSQQRKAGIIFAPEQNKESLIAMQGGYCAAGCGRLLSDLEPYLVHIDHDHSICDMPNVRGVCCNWCNTGIGQAKDCVKLLHAWAEYLTRHKEKLK